MTSAGRPAVRAIEPLPENLFREPIDFLHADHFRLRVLCDHLERLAAASAADAESAATSIADYLDSDFPLHVADEEDDLLPLLRARLSPESGGVEILARLGEEHRRDDELRHRLLPELRRAAAGLQPERPDEFDRAAADFVNGVRQHLAWEETSVFPLARRWLTGPDLEAIGRRMATRRGTAYPDG